MESWFATQGEGFNGVSKPSKQRRVTQIHVACSICSVAGGFLRSLLKDVLWNEEALTKALIEQFEDGEMDKWEQDDILTTMSVLQQGNHDVFTYSCRVLKLLRRQPSGVQHYNKILIGYYIDGLAGCNDPTIGSYNLYHLSPNGIPSGNQRWYGLVYLEYTLLVNLG